MTEIIIKRYKNRKLYDTGMGSYVTLGDVYRRIQRGEVFRVVDLSREDRRDITNETILKAVLENVSGNEVEILSKLLVSTFKTNQLGGQNV